jgi:replication factor C small subunit
MSVEELMWVETYRATRFQDLSNQEAVKGRLGPLIEKRKEFPHLLFAGPHGTGKTTFAMTITRELLRMDGMLGQGGNLRWQVW